MDLIGFIKSFLNRQEWKDATSRPAWRGRATHTRKSRIPFQGRDPRETFGQYMHLERFRVKAARDERFHELRAKGTKNVSKFSDVEGSQSVWYVVRP